MPIGPSLAKSRRASRRADRSQHLGEQRRQATPRRFGRSTPRAPGRRGQDRMRLEPWRRPAGAGRRLVTAARGTRRVRHGCGRAPRSPRWCRPPNDQRWSASRHRWTSASVTVTPSIRSSTGSPSSASTIRRRARTGTSRSPPIVGRDLELVIGLDAEPIAEILRHDHPTRSIDRYHHGCHRTITMIVGVQRRRRRRWRGFRREHGLAGRAVGWPRRGTRRTMRPVARSAGTHRVPAIARNDSTRSRTSPRRSSVGCTSTSSSSRSATRSRSRWPVSTMSSTRRWITAD